MDEYALLDPYSWVLENLELCWGLDAVKKYLTQVSACDAFAVVPREEERTLFEPMATRVLYSARDKRPFDRFDDSDEFQNRLMGFYGQINISDPTSMAWNVVPGGYYSTNCCLPPEIEQ